MMAAQIYEDPDYVRLYVHLKNTGNEVIYINFNNFTLKTKPGHALLPNSTKTYMSEAPFSPGEIPSGSKKEGLIIFDTKDFSEMLIYKDFFGNEVSIDFP